MAVGGGVFSLTLTSPAGKGNSQWIFFEFVNRGAKVRRWFTINGDGESFAEKWNFALLGAGSVSPSPSGRGQG
jgi:hypothetical protein